MAQDDDAKKLVLQTVNGMADLFQKEAKDDKGAVFMAELIRGFVVDGVERENDPNRPPLDPLQLAAEAYLKANQPR